MGLAIHATQGTCSSSVLEGLDALSRDNPGTHLSLGGGVSPKGKNLLLRGADSYL